MGKICVIAFTKNGVKIAEKLGIGDIFVYKKINDRHKYFLQIEDIMPACWENYSSIVFITSCGIAVRAIAPFLNSKNRVSVVVIDEAAKYVVALLSGYLGANKLAIDIAKKIDGIPVITSNSIADEFTIGVWAKENNLVFKNNKLSKDISKAVLNGEKVGYKGIVNCPDGLVEDENAELGVYAGYKLEKPFPKTLILAKKCLALGVNCVENTPFEYIFKLVKKVFKEENLNLDSVDRVASVNSNASEQGILMLSSELHADFVTYGCDYLKRLEGEFSVSELSDIKDNIDCVCERAAVAKGGRLIVKKRYEDGISIAVALI